MKNSRLGIFLLSPFTTTVRALTALALIAGLGFGVASTAAASPPGTPINFTVEPGEGVLSHTTLVLTWEDPRDTGGSAIKGYLITGSATEDGTYVELIDEADSTATTYTETGLSGNIKTDTTRFYRLRVLNTAGELTPVSAQATGTATTAKLNSPSAPRNLTLTVSAPGETPSVTLDWDVPAYNGGYPIVHYEIERASFATDNLQWSAPTVVFAPTTMWTDTDLSNLTTRNYRYRVSAANAGGDRENNGTPVETPLTNTLPDTTAPTLVSITRKDPSTATTNADALIWQVTFSEIVQGVDSSDFTLTGSTARLAAAKDLGSGQDDNVKYTVTASGGNLADLNGEVTLGLYATRHGITDYDDMDTAMAGNQHNALTDFRPSTDATAQSYTLDNAGPSVMLSSTAPSKVDAAFEVTVTFDESVFSAEPGDTSAPFAVSDFDVTGGAASGLTGPVQTGTNQVYTVTITPAESAVEGAEISVSIAARVLEDALGNLNTAATPLTRIFGTADTTAPTIISINRQDPTQEQTNADTLVWRVTFSEAVTGVSTDGTDFAVTATQPGTTTAVTLGTHALAVARMGATNDYDVTLSGTSIAAANADVTLSLASGQDITDITDGADTPNDLSTTLPDSAQDFTLDNTRPSVALASDVLNQVSVAFTVTATFGESVTGFTASELTVGGGAASALTGEGTTYTVTITPDVSTAGAAVTVRLPSNVAVDTAGNENTASNELSYTFGVADNTAPTLDSIKRETPDEATTNSDTLKWRVTFSEAVQGVDASDFTLSDSTATLMDEVVPPTDSIVANTAYDITASGGDLASFTGAVALTLNAEDHGITDRGDSDLDMANDQPNDLTAARPSGEDAQGYTLDNTAPGVTLTSNVLDQVSGDFTVTATFGESVTGFTASDLTVDGGTAGALIGTGTTYTITITPSDSTAGAAVTVSIAAGVATDTAGNGNTASTNTLSYTFGVEDSTVPMLISINRQTPDAATTNSDTLKWRVTFSEAVQGVDADDFALSGSTATLAVADVTDGGVTLKAVYDVTASSGDLANANGAVSLTLNAEDHGITDLGDSDLTMMGDQGNALAASRPTSQSYTLDNIVPTVLLTSNVDDQVGGAFTVTATFSESVPGFTASDLTLVGGTASAFAGEGTTYTFTITPSVSTDDAPISVSIAAGMATDAATNGNTESNTLSYTFGVVDLTAPTLTSINRQTPRDETTKVNMLTWRVTFSEAVQEVDADDFTLSASTATLAVADVTGSGVTANATYDVAASGGNLVGFNGMVSLTLNADDHGITDRGDSDLTMTGDQSNALAASRPTSQTYTLDNTAPRAPSITSAVLNRERTAATLTWTAPADNGGAPITRYEVQRAEGATSDTFTDAHTTADSTTTTYTNSGLTANTVYRYRVRAVNSAGDGTYSDTVTVDTTPPNSLADTLNRLHQTVTVEVARAITNRAVSAVARRVAAAGTNSPSGILGGQSSLGGLLRTHGPAMMDDSMSMRDLFGNSEFVMPLGGSALVANATGDGASGLGAAAFWGQGEFLNMKGETTNIDWDGELLSVQLGFDKKINGALRGAMVTLSEADLDYTDRTDDPSGATGKYKLDYIVFNPYVSSERSDGRADWWATVGYGVGEISISPKGSTLPSTDINGINMALGGSAQLTQINHTTVRLTGEHQRSSMKVERSTDPAEKGVRVNAHLSRIALQADRRYVSDFGYILEASSELGARYDSGDGVSGGAAELSVGMRSITPNGKVTIESSARAFFGRGGYQEWGIDGMVSLDPGSDGQGLFINLSPQYGNTGSSTPQVWERDLQTSGLGAAEVDNTARLNASWGYGLSAGSLRGRVTPYGRMTLSDSQNTYSTGVNWKLGKDLSLDLVQKSTRETANPDNKVLLKGELRF